MLGITGNVAMNVNANVMINSECDLTSISTTTKEKMEIIIPSVEAEEAEVKDLYMCQYDRDIAAYIGGFVIRKIDKNVKCSSCTRGLKTSKPSYKTLTSIKDNGGLIYLHEDIIKAFLIAEKQLSKSLSLNNALKDAFFVEKTSIKIQKACHELIPNLSVHFDEHFSSTFKRMINIYICVRSKYFAKDTNIEMKKNQTRQKLNRLVLFRHL